MKAIKVLIVDDSLFFREILSRRLISRLPKNSQIDTAGEPFEARDKILSFDPDVMVLDVEMPQMNGIEFLRRLMVQYNLPTVVLSSRPAYRDLALEAGAYNFIEKPSTTLGSGNFGDDVAAAIMSALASHEDAARRAAERTAYSEPPAAGEDEPAPQPVSPLRKRTAYTVPSSVGRGQVFTASPNLATGTSVGSGQVFTAPPRINASGVVKTDNKVSDVSSRVTSDMHQITKMMQEMTAKASAGREKPVSVPVSQIKAPVPSAKIKLIAIGASTGGTEALSSILKTLVPPLPPILVVQHIPPMFSRLFAERLHNECQLSVKEAVNGDTLEPNWVYIAPGSKQMRLKGFADNMVLDVNTGEKVNGHCPSVDVLFHSVADKMGNKALGVILTGMGEDGARGLLRMRECGAVTLGQDGASCVVYGMPRAAYEMGAVTQQLPLSAMAGMITTVARS